MPVIIILIAIILRPSSARRQAGAVFHDQLLPFPLLAAAEQ